MPKNLFYSVQEFADFLYANWDNIPHILNDSDTRYSLEKEANIPSALLDIYKHNVQNFDAYNTCLLAIMDGNGTLRFKDFIISFDSIANLSFSNEMKGTLKQVLRSDLFGILSKYAAFDIGAHLRFLQKKFQQQNIAFNTARTLYEIRKQWYFKLPNHRYCLTLRQIFEGIENSEDIAGLISDKELISYISYKISLEKLPIINKDLIQYSRVLMPWFILSKARMVEKKPQMPKTYSVFLSIITNIIQSLPRDKFDSHKLMAYIESSNISNTEELVEFVDKKIAHSALERQEKLKNLPAINKSYIRSVKQQNRVWNKVPYPASIVSCVLCSIIILAML
ncbi:hypothetical protein Cyrtocomes_00967 [Candidatus Cyrtobacter comes]|uniref:Uncharacterized protein n=1 Tax=Candidatus Cyrtobacter comes TaxID=675776 RepID=A0ABU5L8Y6_9RICK|nr:hypothetical protein [Candidatus Cyrtobacter comes]MDZ5762578.1 hypothetical protein [Candidatus Cyrtobacter comes]